MKANHYNNTHILAQNYAASDRSDPFTYSRIMTHIASGLCDDKIINRGEPVDCRYSAEPFLETRRLPPTNKHPEGEEYQVTVYKNVRRP